MVRLRVIVLAAIGAATYRLGSRIPCRELQLFVGALIAVQRVRGFARPWIDFIAATTGRGGRPPRRPAGLLVAADGRSPGRRAAARPSMPPG